MGEFKLNIDNIDPFFDEKDEHIIRADVTIKHVQENYSDTAKLTVFIDKDKVNSIDDMKNLFLKRAQNFLNEIIQNDHVFHSI